MLVRWFARIAVLVGVFLGVPGEQARADGSGPTIALLDVEMVGVEPELQAELKATVLRTVEELGFTAVSHDDVRKSLRDRPDLQGCSTPACLRALPPLLGTNRFLRLWVEASGTVYNFEISLLLAGGETNGGAAQRAKNSCAVCTTRELTDGLTKTTKELMSVFRAVPVAITSSPEGASLRIGDRDAGKTPYTGELLPGSYKVTATLNGHMAAEQTIEVAMNAKEPQSFTLTLTQGATSGGGGGGSSDGRPFRIWKWPVATMAVAALGTGVVWVLVDGNGTCGGGDDQACEKLYDTGTPGLVSLGAGAALGALAGWMFWRDHQDGRTAEPAISPTAGGAVGGVRVRF